ncbi:hypothetical protein K7432_015490 [Basidiobolus ranarum]|uniref:Uncharacterized protein n=1 Tax=Basidiobolus ranarum TaxID=34480 RepID=A0ABR2WG06_9FUNG
MKLLYILFALSLGFTQSAVLDTAKSEHLIERANPPYRRPYPKADDLKMADDGTYCAEPLSIPIPSIMEVITICI